MRFIRFVVGDVCAQACSAFGYFLCARLLSAHDFGLFSLAQNAIQWFAPLVLWSFSSFGIHILQASRRAVYVAWEMTRFRVLIGGISAILILVLALPLSSSDGGYRQSDVMLTVSFAGVLLLLRAFEQDHLSLALDRTISYYSFRVAYAGGFLLCLAIAEASGFRDLHLFLALQVISMGAAIALQWNLLRQVRASESREVSQGLVGLNRFDLCNSGVITGGSFFMMGAYNLDLFMLLSLGIGTFEELASYAVLAKCIQFAVLPMSAALTSQAPMVTRAFFAKDAVVFWSHWKRIAALTVVSGVFGAIGIVVFGAQLLEIIMGRSHGHGMPMMIWFALVYLFIGFSAPFISILPYVQAGRSFLSLYTVLIIIVFLSLLWLLPRYGMCGAPMALAVGLAVLSLSAAVTFRSLCVRHFIDPLARSPSAHVSV